MKKIFIVLLVVIGLSSVCEMSAQTVAKAQELQQQFNQMRIEGSQATESEIYSVLHQCYKEYVSVLNTAEAGTPDYEQAKQGVLDIHQYLYNGAAYHQTRGVRQNATVFAQAYVDVTLMEAFQNETFVKDEQFSTITYLAASGAYNAREFEKAINYFAVYLSTGDQRNRESVYAFMAKACLGVKNRELAKSVLEEGISQYPQNFTMLSTAINCCIEDEDNNNLQRYVTLALAIKPNDETLLNIQGKLYEDTQEFSKALDVYNRLNTLKPNNLTIMQHIALNQYNQGVLNFNKATLQETESEAQMYSSQANEAFTAAVSSMELILANTPNSVKYMQALAVAYDCLGNVKEFEDVNKKLASMGAATIEANVTPTLLTHAAKSLTTTTAQNTTTSTNNAAAPKSNVLQMLAQQKGEPEYKEAPKYSVYAKDYVEPRIKAWQEKDPYETVAEYQARVTEESRDAKMKELLQAAEANYIKAYAGRVRVDEMKLKPYDADNQAFLIESEYGELIVPVPRERNEARIFESSWNGMQVKDPVFYISNDKMLLSGLTFVTPTGVTYRYDGKKELNYTETVVDVSFDPINTDMLASSNNVNTGSKVKKQTLTVEGVKSDVDINIPEISTKNENLYALIIANENYSMVSGVPYALNDGQTFAEYCEKTLGLPEKNVLLYKDASFGIMLNAMDKVKKLAAARGGDMELIFYYAGHGIPDESSKDAFLLPIDSDGKQTKVCYSLNDIYSELGAMNTQSVTVFLDACFSGAKRDGGMVAEARGVAIKPKQSAPTGNMVVFSAVSDDETALPYEEKGHGMFTYFLLKKLQETQGDVTLKELSDYIKQKVSSESILINDKSQTPTVTTSAAVNDTWQQMKLGQK